MVMKIFSVLIAFCAYLLMTVVSFIFKVAESSWKIKSCWDLNASFVLKFSCIKTGKKSPEVAILGGNVYFLVAEIQLPIFFFKSAGLAISIISGSSFGCKDAFKSNNIFFLLVNCFICMKQVFLLSV